MHTLDIIADDLHVTSAWEKVMILSIFMLGFALGPLFISPISEILGRTRVLQTFNLGYLAFNTACGASRTGPQILVLRFLSGLFGSCSVGIGAGTLGDMFESHERGKAMAVYSVAPLIGPVLGPMMGGFLASRVSWRWVFYLTSIMDALVQIWALFFLEESYAPVLLRRRSDKLQATSFGSIPPIVFYTEHDFPEDSKMELIRVNMIRPFKMLATQVIIQVVALYQGYLYGNIYILYAYFPTLWTGRYGEAIDIASLNYLSIGLGTVFAAEVTMLINDRIYRYLTNRANATPSQLENGGVSGGGRPEFRIPITIPATLLLAVGIFWYGWSAENRLHWIMPNIGCALFTAGAYVCTVSNNTYIVDTYGHYSASGLAAISMLRCLAGFAFPLFSPYIYDALGCGLTNTILGSVVLGLGLPAAILLWKYGETLRRKSPYCAVGS